MGLFSTIKSAFGAPDPLRFANLPEAAPPTNWDGSLTNRSKGKRAGPVCIDEATNTFEFPDHVAGEWDISPELSEREKDLISLYRYDPNNIKYQKAKAYFAKNPTCKAKDIAAAAEVGEKGTAKDLLAIFNKCLSMSPTPQP